LLHSSITVAKANMLIVAFFNWHAECRSSE
jgi:hypothetical protein